jgi:hypothetical protein
MYTYYIRMFSSLGVKTVVRIKTAQKGSRLHEHEPWRNHEIRKAFLPHTSQAGSLLTLPEPPVVLSGWEGRESGRVRYKWLLEPAS